MTGEALNDNESETTERLIAHNASRLSLKLQADKKRQLSVECRL